MGRSVSIVVTPLALRIFACFFATICLLDYKNLHARFIHIYDIVDYYLLVLYACMFLFRFESLGTKDPTFHHGPKFLLALV